MGTLVGLAIAYEAALFVAHDFDPDYSHIDRCLDRGGVWNYAERACEHQR